MKKTIIICVCVLVVLAATPFCVKSELPHYNSVIRFHIRANSDTDEDQAVKMKVRNEVVKLVSSLTQDCRDAAEAEKVMIENLPVICTAANAVLAENGFSYNASAALTTEEFGEKEYGGVIFPRGIYRALRVELGKAEGHNFWCVLFPPICLADACTDEVLSDYGIDDFNGKFVIRFKIWDYIKKKFAAKE